LRRSSLDRVCWRVNSASRCFFLTISIITFCSKTKNPRVLNPGVLEVCCVNLCYTTVLRDPWQISGVRSYDEPSLLIDNQEQAITPACLGIVLN
jgi:hypothetical protein